MNNLNPLEKCIEQLLKNQLDEFLGRKGVLPEYHHESRKRHSTLTAPQTIQQNLLTNQDGKRHSAVVLTYLGLAPNM